MEPHLAQSIEIETIAELLPELNYYQILQVDPLAPANVIEKSYRSEARRLHPDRYARNPDEQTKRKANQIYRAVMEAWKTLKDPETRSAYDLELEDGHRRMTEEAKNKPKLPRQPIHSCCQNRKGMKFGNGSAQLARRRVLRRRDEHPFALNLNPTTKRSKSGHKAQNAHEEVADETKPLQAQDRLADRLSIEPPSAASIALALLANPASPSPAVGQLHTPRPVRIKWQIAACRYDQLVVGSTSNHCVVVPKLVDQQVQVHHPSVAIANALLEAALVVFPVFLPVRMKTGLFQVFSMPRDHLQGACSHSRRSTVSTTHGCKKEARPEDRRDTPSPGGSGLGPGPVRYFAARGGRRVPRNADNFTRCRIQLRTRSKTLGMVVHTSSIPEEKQGHGDLFSQIRSPICANNSSGLWVSDTS